ncbi:hypothetical protein LCGC14_1116580 [marine sediment metagenome]|uniref:Uncharacterized protein n=1 Tax=marine sediment metagenome TaxID=412755 RepID=A0A0F9M9Z3_9ZZZZ
MKPELPLDIDHTCEKRMPNVGVGVNTPRAFWEPPYGRPQPTTEKVCPACCYIRGWKDGLLDGKEVPG